MTVLGSWLCRIFIADHSTPPGGRRCGKVEAPAFPHEPEYYFSRLEERLHEHDPLSCKAFPVVL